MAESGVNVTIEYSLNGSTWTDISGTSNELTVSEQKIVKAKTNTFAHKGAIVTLGKFDTVELTLKGLYTEDSNGIFESLRGYYRSKTPIYVRYCPLGKGAPGRAVYTSSNDDVAPGPVYITDMLWPGAAANSADPIPALFMFEIPFLLRTVTGSSTGLGT